MKKMSIRSKVIASAVCLVSFIILLPAFQLDREENQIDKLILKNFHLFVESAENFVKVSEAFERKEITTKQLQEELEKVRVAYKKPAFILNYYYPTYIEEHLNGAPLYHAEKYGTHSLVKPPQGLQVLHELVFSEEAPQKRPEISILCRDFLNKVWQIRPELQTRTYPFPDLLEAMRMELIRTFSMSLGGFDTPGNSQACIPETISAFSSMLSILETQSAEEFSDLKDLFKNAIQQLDSEQDINQFDHLLFYKKFISPLYSKITKYQKEKGIPAKTQFPTGRNLESEQIFGTNFLNPYFYSDLQKKEDSQKLKELGETLFYDKKLSANGEMSCGTCHEPKLGFTDGQPKSASNIAGQTVMRNAPTLINAVFADRYFYDMRAFSLEQQAEHVIFNHAEFNTEYEEILSKLNKNSDYKKAFKSIFSQPDINRNQFSKALASYVLSLQSFNSPFDQYVRGESNELSEAAKRGFNLFMGKGACGTCHFPPLFSGLMPPYFSKNESEILGVLESPHQLRKRVDEDPGRQANGIQHENVWIYEKSFKTPTIRNIERTGPYFHNGAYSTLELVVDFYNHGGGAGIGLEVNNQTLSPDHLELSKQEKADLIAFMKSLTESLPDAN